MKVIDQEKQLPRFFKEFIGKGRQLQEKRKQRRKVQLQERSIANRVLFLQKQQMKAQKSLINKRQQLDRIMQIAERQNRQKSQKQRLLLQRERQIEKAKQENRLSRIYHRQNQQRSTHLILQRNSLDFKISKKKLEQGENRKKLQQMHHLNERKQRYMTLNLMKQQGRSRIDTFFKNKNKQHTQLYLQKISLEQQKTKQKLTTIKKLENFEEMMRKRLQESSLRVSQMDQILGNVSQQVRRRTASNSRSSRKDQSTFLNSPTLITSIQGELLNVSSNSQSKRSVGKEGLSEDNKNRKRKNSNYQMYFQHNP